MSKRQTRRSISIRGLSDQRLEHVARELHERGEIPTPSKSGAVEYMLAETAKRLGIPEEKVLRPRKPSQRRPGPAPHAACFTF